jgi:hypothetical protein
MRNGRFIPLEKQSLMKAVSLVAAGGCFCTLASGKKAACVRRTGNGTMVKALGTPDTRTA